MSQTLYEEAIAEARRLTEMAEQNAKNKIIDAITPQIRQLIEQELMGEAQDIDDEMESDEDEDAVVPEDGAVSDASVFDLDALSAPQGAAAASGPVSADTSHKAPQGTSLKMDGGEIEITVGGTKIEIEPADGEKDHEDELLLDEPVMEALERMVAESRRGASALRSKLEALFQKTGGLKIAMAEARTSGTRQQKARLAKVFESLALEAVALRKQVILTEMSAGGRTPETKLINSIIKEMKDMSRRNGKNVFDFLFEAEEGEDKGVEMDMGGEGEEEKADVDVDAIRDAVESLAGALGMSVEEKEDDSDDSDTEDKGDNEVLELEADMPKGEEMPEGSYAKMEMEEGEKMEETVYELDESTLRDALTSLRRGRKIREAAVDAAESFGGGEAGDEMFVDVDEETLLNVLADELGTAKAPKVGGAELAKESRRDRSKRVVSEVAKLRQQVADYRQVAEQLKGQLTEMNLFNAKLLYANKLMQNRDLSAKQQRAIVEALDNAKTLREAKLLYKSLTESLNKGANKGSLSEGHTRVLGSSSKSARSAQPINEAGGTDRWALLAGIKKD